MIGSLAAEGISVGLAGITAKGGALQATRAEHFWDATERSDLCPVGRLSAALSDSPLPALYLVGKAVSSDVRDALASGARYAGIRARKRPLRH
ncbi:MAG: hypothetical protein WAN22_12485 [Solirubrobacteraceae bacterium]